MKKCLWLTLVLLGCAPGVYAAEDDLSQGLTAATQSRWMEAQMRYARAVKQYGAGSSEATEAEVMMNTLGRQLGIQPSGAVPESVTIKPPKAPDLSDLQTAEEPASAEATAGKPAASTSTAK